MAKHLKASNSLELILVDDDIYEIATLESWSLDSGGYARSTRMGYLHDLVLGEKKNSSLVANHKNHNRLDNRRVNLERITAGLNRMLANAPARGCVLDRRTNRWSAYVYLNRKRISLRYWDTLIQAKQIHEEACLYIEELHRVLNSEYEETTN